MLKSNLFIRERMIRYAGTLPQEIFDNKIDNIKKTTTYLLSFRLRIRIWKFRDDIKKEKGRICLGRDLSRKEFHRNRAHDELAKDGCGIPREESLGFMGGCPTFRFYLRSTR